MILSKTLFCICELTPFFFSLLFCTICLRRELLLIFSNLSKPKNSFSWIADLEIDTIVQFHCFSHFL